MADRAADDFEIIRERLREIQREREVPNNTQPELGEDKVGECFDCRSCGIACTGMCCSPYC